MFALSTENLGRAETEVNLILRMTERMIAQETTKLVEGGIRVNFIGDRSRLPHSLQRAMKRSVTILEKSFHRIALASSMLCMYASGCPGFIKSSKCLFSDFSFCTDGKLQDLPSLLSIVAVQGLHL